MQPLEGRTALVTGSVQGIGLSIATALAAQGASVAVHGIAEQSVIDAAMAEVRCQNVEVNYFSGDLRIRHEIGKLVDLVQAWRPIDIVVNNAGIQRVASLKNVTSEIWDDVIGVNLTAPFEIMRRVLPDMAKREYGRVINIASVHGLVGSIDKAPYVASKFGLVGMSRVAALEYASVGSARSGGVTINCICPGFTETPILTPQIDARANDMGVDRDLAIASLLAEKQPSKRLSHPDEIADLAVWLCGRAAHNLTGTAIPVDGGWTAQ